MRPWMRLAWDYVVAGFAVTGWLALCYALLLGGHAIGLK